MKLYLHYDVGGRRDADIPYAEKLLRDYLQLAEDCTRVGLHSLYLQYNSYRSRKVQPLLGNVVSFTGNAF